MSLPSGLCRVFIRSLEPKRPTFESTQEHGIEWLAAAHATAEATLRSRRGDAEPFNVDAFHAQMRKFLGRFGCSPEKIARRGHMLEDFTHLDFARMRVFGVTKSPEGAGIGERNAFFHESARAMFQEFYQGETAAPDDMVHVSCTGYISPSAAQEIVVEKGWERETHVTHAYHMGCYAAVPALRMAAGFLSASHSNPRLLGKKTRVDIVHTELCTLHLNPLTHSPEQLVVQSLFADGFIRYEVVTEEELAKTPLPKNSHGDNAQSSAQGLFEILSLREEMVPASREAMTWDLSPVGFAMTLSREVPQLISGCLEGCLERLFAQAGLDYRSERENTVFAVHPGGPKIIEKVEELLALDPWQTVFSKSVLHAYGNMSSATLPHIWDAVARDASIAPGTLVASLAFGPGLSVCGALLRKATL